MMMMQFRVFGLFVRRVILHKTDHRKLWHMSTQQHIDTKRYFTIDPNVSIMARMVHLGMCVALGDFRVKIAQLFHKLYAIRASARQLQRVRCMGHNKTGFRSTRGCKHVDN